MAKQPTLKGLGNFKAKIAQLKDGGVGLAKKAVFSGALIIQSLAVQKAAYKTGTLRRSITINVVVKGQVVIARIGTNLEYARRIEYGFMDTDSRGRVYHQAARPYLRPAFDEGKAQANAEMKAALVAQLNAL